MSIVCCSCWEGQYKLLCFCWVKRTVWAGVGRSIENPFGLGAPADRLLLCQLNTFLRWECGWLQENFNLDWLNHRINHYYGDMAGRRFRTEHCHDIIQMFMNYGVRAILRKEPLAQLRAHTSLITNEEGAPKSWYLHYCLPGNLSRQKVRIHYKSCRLRSRLLAVTVWAEKWR
jgi:hypothetical protein